MNLCDESRRLTISPRRLQVSGHRISNQVATPAQCLNAWCWAATTEFLWSLHSSRRTQAQVAATHLESKCAHACSNRDRDCDQEQDLEEVLRKEGLLGKDGGESISDLVLGGTPVALDVRDGSAGHFPAVSGWIKLGDREPFQEYAEVRDPAGGLLRYIDATILTKAYPGWGPLGRRFVIEKPKATPPLVPRKAASIQRQRGWLRRFVQPDLMVLARELLDQLRTKIEPAPAGLIKAAEDLLGRFFSIPRHVPPLERIDPAQVQLCGPLFVASVKKFLEVPGIQMDATWGFGLYAQDLPFGFIELQALGTGRWRLESLTFAVDVAGDRFVRAIEAALGELDRQEGDIAVVLRVPRLRENAMLLIGAPRELRDYRAVPLRGAFTFLGDEAAGLLTGYLGEIVALELAQLR